jgi:phosphate-selective porin OprO and OprP
MAAERVARAAALACIVLAISAVRVWAEEKRVVDELLDILRSNKQITEQQYRALKSRAEDERQQDLRQQAVEKTAVATPTAVLAAAPPATPPPGETMRAYYKNGFNLESAGGDFKLIVGALTQLDWNVSLPGAGVQRKFMLQDTYNGFEFRRARLYIAGTVFKNIDYKFEYDFAENASGQPAFKDVYMGMGDIPYVQYVRVGYFKEPFSLEELTSDWITTFQERATMNAFAQPDRNTGIAVYQTYLDQRMTFASGFFRLTNNFGDGFGSDAPYDITARLTGLPAYVAGDNLIHLGLSYSHKFRDFTQQSQETLSFASRPEAHLFPVNLVNTGKINTDGADLVDPEIALVRGPLAIQGEYTWALVQQADQSNPTFGGGYVEASYFLTGESRASFYRLDKGHFDRVMPIHNFSIDGEHWGAWQLAARFSRIDLSSEAVGGGALDDVTGGLNWYLNPVTRITVNYIWAHRESVGDSNVVQGRFQLAF